jgi:hypothetical protein
MTQDEEEQRSRWLTDYIAGRVTVPGQRVLSREEADAALALLRASLKLPQEIRE